MSKLTIKRLILSSLVALGIWLPAYTAQAKIMFMPPRAVFQDRDRTADILMVNTDSTEATFRLAWSYQYQTEDNGKYIMAKGPTDPALDPAKMVVFSPRQVTLAPGDRQRIRLSLRRPPDLPAGEYHAHLKLQRIANEAANVPAPSDPTKATLGLGINVSFAIPVIIRQGKYDASASISNPQFIPSQKGAPPALEFTLSRAGVHGTMGSIKIFWTPPGGQEQQIGLANNINIFTEITKRVTRVNLTEASVAGGTLRIVYEGVGPDKGIKFDEKSFPIGG